MFMTRSPWPSTSRSIRSFPDALEILMEVSCATGGHRDAARFLGAAEALRQRQGGTVRFAIYEPAYAAAVTNLRDVLGDEFDAARAEGAALSLEEAIAYAQRGRGERKRPSTGWGSLTPTDSTSSGWWRRAGQQGHRRHGYSSPTARCRRT